MQVYILTYDLLAVKEGVITVTTLHSTFIQNQTFFFENRKILRSTIKTYKADKKLFRKLGTKNEK
jgi:predicted nucleic-acid-binding protein